MSKKIIIIFLCITLFALVNSYYLVEAKSNNKVNNSTECILLPGRTINQNIMNLAGTESATIISGDTVTQNSTVKAIKRASVKPKNTKMINISQSTTKPVYMWYDGSTGTIYWYSETANPIMNSNSTYLFSNLVALEDIRGVADWDASRIISTQCLFERCFHLTDLTGVDTWKTTSLMDMGYTFFRYYDNDDPNYKMTNLNALANWDVSRVTNMRSVFYGLQYITSLEALENWNTSNVTNLSYAFMHLHNLESLKGLENWNTSKVTNMYNTFSHLHIVTDISAVENWDVSNVQNLGGTWRSCRRLEDISPLSNWNITNVKIMGEDTYWGGTFSYDDNVVDFSPIANWDVSNVTDMRCLFQGCSKMSSIMPFTFWNTSNVIKFDKMFQGCSLIKDARTISNWNIKLGTSFVNIFNATIEYYPQWADGTWEAGTFTKNVITDTNGENDENQSESSNETTKAKYILNLKSKIILDENGNNVRINNEAINQAVIQKKINDAIKILQKAGITIINKDNKLQTITIEYTI